LENFHTTGGEVFSNLAKKALENKICVLSVKESITFDERMLNFGRQRPKMTGFRSGTN
jgi:hypothetical protein